jgi:hypothetical protein
MNQKQISVTHGKKNNQTIVINQSVDIGLTEQGTLEMVPCLWQLNDHIIPPKVRFWDWLYNTHQMQT